MGIRLILFPSCYTQGGCHALNQSALQRLFTVPMSSNARIGTLGTQAGVNGSENGSERESVLVSELWSELLLERGSELWSELWLERGSELLWEPESEVQGPS
jgi:hypothetical protein